MVLLSQSGLAQTWWEDAAMHWLYGKIRIPSLSTKPLTPFKLFYGQKPNVSLMRPFGCLLYVHLQKDQCPALAPHAAQCILIGYPHDYKRWSFWDPVWQKEFISDTSGNYFWTPPRGGVPFVNKTPPRGLMCAAQHLMPGCTSAARSN